jgi:hypothetical protein
LAVGDIYVYGYGLMKLAEIPAAGALLVTDVPMERVRWRSGSSSSR